MLKNLTYVSIAIGFLSALIAGFTRWQDTRLFVATRGWLSLGEFFLLAAICFVLLSIDEHLGKRG